MKNWKNPKIPIFFFQDWLGFETPSIQQRQNKKSTKPEKISSNRNCQIKPRKNDNSSKADLRYGPRRFRTTWTWPFSSQQTIFFPGFVSSFFSLNLQKIWREIPNFFQTFTYFVKIPWTRPRCPRRKPWTWFSSRTWGSWTRCVHRKTARTRPWSPSRQGQRRNRRKTDQKTESWTEFRRWWSTRRKWCGWFWLGFWWWWRNCRTDGWVTKNQAWKGRRRTRKGKF